MPKYAIGDGESIISVAADHGFFWQTIWNHPENAGLKEKRRDPNILFKGDEVFIPDKELKEEQRATEQKHTFKRRGEPVKFKLQLMFMGQPRANEDYVLEVDGKLIQGKTDSQGKLEHFVPGNAKGGRVLLRGGKEQYPVRIGHLDPCEELSGVQQRLNNLGFECGAEDGQLNDTTKAALRAFQTKHNLNVTGEPDAATIAKLQSLHP